MPAITLHKAIVHELVKEQHKEIQKSNIRPTALDVSKVAVKKLISDIVDVYGDRENSAHYGTFLTTGARGRFPGAFEAYAKVDVPRVNEKNFIDLSRCAMDELYRCANLQSAASGGYIVVSDYSLNAQRFFLVAMIKQTPGMTISATLDPEELMRLDLDRLHQAARINFGKLSQYNSAQEDAKKEINYLTFISPRNEASGYFISAIGCAPGNTSSRATKAVIQETTALFKGDERLRKNHDAFRKALLEYLDEKEARQQSVKISEIGHLVESHIPTELVGEAKSIVNDIVTKLNSEDVGVPAEFPVHKNELKKHTHISGRAANWRVEFDRQALSDSDDAPIYYNRELGTLTFKGIPDDLQKLIEDELKLHGEEQK